MSQFVTLLDKKYYITSRQTTHSIKDDSECVCVVSIGLSATFIKLVLLSLVFLVRLNQNNTNLLHFWRVQIIGVKKSNPTQHKPYMIRQKKVKVAHKLAW